MKFKTEQERFWAGEFGDDYISRNEDQKLIGANCAFFSKALARTETIGTALELGANIGLNLHALRMLWPRITLGAVEINERAVTRLRAEFPESAIRHGSILEFDEGANWDLVFTKGVLIHINPDELPSVYDALWKASKRYILVAEYYNPAPIEVNYRGHSGRLFKRDFAGELALRHPDLHLVDYGFVYRKDPQFPQDDLTWFLLEKRK